MVSLERQLQLAALALHEKIVTPAAMIAALQKFSADTEQSLLEQLIESGGLSAAERSRIEGLAGEIPTQLSAVHQTPTVSFIQEAEERKTDLKIASEPPPINVRFQPLRLHARGGLGQVSLARDNEIPREVALKQIVPRQADDPATRRRFVREAEITGQLEHPGIVPVYGLGTTPDGRPYYAMRFIRGETLLKQIQAFHQQAPRDFGGRAFRQLVTRLAAVCQAMQYAHDRGVVHRDLKPENIMLGGYGETLVVDWGLAKATIDVDDRMPLGPLQLTADEQTLAGATFGTPAYMSPEQAAGNLPELGPASDIYSLGATLYCLLTGRPPYLREQEQNILQAVQVGKFPAPDSLVPGVPRPLAAVSLRAMAIRPADRYATVAELSQDIENWLADEKVSVHRESAIEGSSRWLRKHRTLASASLAATIMVLLGLAIGSAVLATKNQQLAVANQKEQEATRTAQFRLGQIEKANNVLVEIFQDINPIAERKHRSLAQLLATRLVQAGEKLQQDVSGDPLTTAKMQNALGVTLQSLDFHVEAEKLHALAKTTRERALGREHAETLQSATNLAMSWRARGDLQQAIPLLEATLASQRKALGLDHDDTLTTQANLAGAVNEAGDNQRAIELYADAWERRKKTSGPQDLATLMILSNLAGAHESAGNLPKAIELYETAEREAREHFGESHHVVSQIQNNLGYAYKQAGRVPEALQFYQRSWQTSQDRFGADHPDTLQAQSNYASALSAVGRASEALPLHETAFRGLSLRFGESHPTTLAAQQALAYDCLQLGQPERAIPLLESVLKHRTAVRGAEHPETLRTVVGLGEAYSHSGKYVDALRLLESATKLQVKVLGPEHPDTLRVKRKLAAVYAELNRADQAIPILEDTLTQLQALHGEDHPDVLLVEQNLAGAYCAVGKMEEGIALYHSVIARSETVFGPSHVRTLTTKDLLASVYLRQKKPQDAIPLLLEIWEAWQAAEGDADDRTLQSRGELAAAYTQAGDHAGANKHYAAIFQQREEQSGKLDPAVLKALNQLAVSYQHLNQNAHSLELLHDLVARQAEAQIVSPDAFWVVRLNLGNAHLALKQWDEASKYLAELQAAANDESIALSPLFRDALKRQVPAKMALAAKQKQAEQQK